MDSGYPSCSSSCGNLEDELNNELILSEKRRYSLSQSFNNAQHALYHQKNCLQQQENDIAHTEITLGDLLQRQQLLESRFYYVKHNNFSSVVPIKHILEPNVQCLNFSPRVTDSTRITSLEKEINDIKMKLKRQSLWRKNNSLAEWSAFQERKNEEAEVQEELRRHAEHMEDKCNDAQRERDTLEFQMSSLHSGLHQAKMTSKELEKECVKLHSEIAASRKINENLHLELSTVKKYSQSLENVVRGSKSENKSLHLQVQHLQQENQSLLSQKELLFGVMKKKGKLKDHNEEQKISIPKESQVPEHGKSICRNTDSDSMSQLSCVSSTKSSRRAPKLDKPRKREIKYKSNIGDRKQGNEFQVNKSSCRKAVDSDSASQQSCVSSTRKSRRPRNSRRKREIKSECKNYERNQENECHLNEYRADKHRDSCRPTCPSYSERSETDTETILACYEHLAELLGKLESLLQKNTKLDTEKKHTLKLMLETLKELKGCKSTTDESREQVEELLNEHSTLKENYHKILNQITAVIIELKHLRRAYHGILRHSKDPKDKDAMVWISRVQAIKDSLKLLKLQEKTVISTQEDSRSSN